MPMTTVQRRAFNDQVTRFWGRAAKAYDWAPLQQWVYRPAQDEMIALLRLHGSQRVVDIACGTGILASRIQDELAPEQVYGVDMSEGMLAQAKARSPQVNWRFGPAEQLPFEDGALDAVISTSAFHFFDQPAALAEFHRVLAPGGFAAVTTFTPDRTSPLLRRFLGDRVPASMPTKTEMRQMFETAGFDIAVQRPVHHPVTIPFVEFDRLTVGVKR
ncbi:MAG: class I SAM-dependent methyltransferase [Mycobacterium sp.]